MENSFTTSSTSSSSMIAEPSEDAGSLLPRQTLDTEDRCGTLYGAFSSLYGQSESISRPSYALGMRPPFTPPSLEQSINSIRSASGGAFRPVSSLTSKSKEANSDTHISAFSPAKRSHTVDPQQGQASAIPVQLYPASGADDEGSQKADHPKTSSCNLDMPPKGNDAQITEESRPLRRQRKKLLLDSQQHRCPVCGLTLRLGEVSTHLTWEMDKLDKITRPGRKSGCKDNGQYGGKVHASGSRKGSIKDGENSGTQRNERHETYQKIKTNRQARLCARGRRRKKPVEETICPVCEKKVTGTSDDLTEHVDLCLKTKEEEADSVDIEGDTYEEYEWCGETRIRTTTLLPGGLGASGFQTAAKATSDEEDFDLDVDGNDEDHFGQPQYSEADLIPCASEEPIEDKETRALRRAYIRSEMQQVQSIPSERTRWDMSGGGDSEDAHMTDDTDPDPVENASQSAQQIQSHNQEEVIASLKAKIREQESLLGRERPKCLICMEPYQTPLTSTQCWHVHCEECWLRTLGTKKLCPQCNTITSPTDLRRIYL